MRTQSLRWMAGAGAAALICISGPAWAQGRADLRTARAFQMLDADNSGAVNLEEYRAGAKQGEAEKVENNFRRVDKDNDGQITPQELRAEWATANNVLRQDIFERGEIASARVEEAAFVALDTDGNDFVSLEEFREGARRRADNVQQAFRRVDADNNGQISRQEFAENWRRARGVLRDEIFLSADSSARTEHELAFQALDTDNDGEISREEYLAGVKEEERERAEEAFQYADNDDDDAISSEELRVAWVGLGDLVRSELYEDASTAAAIERRGGDGAALFQELDADNSGALSPREFRAAIEADSRAEARSEFRQMDTNNNGQIDAEEFRPDRLNLKERYEQQ